MAYVKSTFGQGTGLNYPFRLPHPPAAPCSHLLSIGAGSGWARLDWIMQSSSGSVYLPPLVVPIQVTAVL